MLESDKSFGATRYLHSALKDRNLGPKSLRERVTALGGTLAVHSSQGGALLEITIQPVAKPGVRDGD
jgi:glucose-6-phosphate-specific signal transduction histidine kinase